MNDFGDCCEDGSIIFSRRRVLTGSSAVIATATLSGCEGLVTSNPNYQFEFRFEEVTFTDGEATGVGEYDQQPENTYARGDTVCVYLEIYDPPTWDGQSPVTFVFEVETPDGDQWEPVESKWTWWDAKDSTVMYSEDFDTTAADEPGDYDMTITVTDREFENRVKTTETFTLE